MPPPLKNLSSLIHTKYPIAGTATRLQIRDHVGNAAPTVVQTIVSEADTETAKPSNKQFSKLEIAGIVIGAWFGFSILGNCILFCILYTIEKRRCRTTGATKPGEELEAQEGNEENPETYADRVYNTDISTLAGRRLPATDSPSSDTSTTAGEQTLVTGSSDLQPSSPSTEGDEDNNQYTINAPDVTPTLDYVEIRTRRIH